MPFYSRPIEPANLARKVADLTDVGQKPLLDSKEECNNRILANIIRQLASLGRHASDIFEVLEYEAQIIEGRTQNLLEKTQRVNNKLKVRITLLGILHFPLTMLPLTALPLKSDCAPLILPRSINRAPLTALH